MASAAEHDCAEFVRRVTDATAAGDVAGILALMRTGKADAIIQAHCCIALNIAVKRDAGVIADAKLVAELLEALLSGLRAHAADGCLILEASTLLMHLHGMPQHVSQALALGAAETTVTIMSAQPDGALAQSACCQVLFMLAESDNFGFRAGAVRAVLAALSTHSGDYDTQVRALAALHRLAWHEPNAQEALAAGALETVVSVLRTHTSDGDDILKASCLALQSLAISSEVAQEATRLDAVPAIVSILQRGAALTGDSKMSEAASAVLECLVQHSVQARTAAGASGGVEAVVAVLRAHPQATSLQYCGWTTLTSLFQHDTQNAVLANHAGALALMVAALREHVAYAPVVQSVCLALSCLVNRTATAKAAGQLGVVPLIVAGMQSHAANEALQFYACGVLAVLMRDCSVNAETAHRVGAVHVVETAVRIHDARAEIVELGEAALALLQRAADSGSSLLASAGGTTVQAEHPASGGSSALNMAPHVPFATGSSAPPAHTAAVPDGALARIEHARAANDFVGVVSQLRACPADAEVQMAGFAALSGMIAGAADPARNAAATAAAAAGAITAVTAALRRFPAHMGVMEQVCACVSGLALDGTAEEVLARSGTAELLVTLLKNKGASKKLQTQACIALGVLCRTAESKAHAGQMGAIEAVIAVLAKHASHRGVKSGVAFALSLLLNECPANVGRAQRAGGLQVMRAVLRAHGSDADLTQHALHVISLLQQHAASAASAADAAMAELLAEEVAERAAKAVKPAARKSKKKRSGVQCAAAAADASEIGTGTLAEAASASKDGAAAIAGDAAVAVAAAAVAPAAAVRVPEADAPPAAVDTSSAAAELPLPLQAVPHDLAAAGAHDADNSGAAGGVDDVLFAAAASNLPPSGPAAIAPFSAAPVHSLESAATPAAALPRLPAPPPYCPPRGAPQLTRCAPPPSAPLSDEAAAAMLPPYLAELILGAPPQAQHAPPPLLPAAPLPAASLPRAPSPPPPPVMKECCVCLLDVPQNELHLLMLCGHRCVCAECAAALMARPPASRLCPKCREPVLRAAPVFDE
jgi:hypothetical protein